MGQEAINRRVLCVDDEPRVLEGLSQTLFEEFEVSTAGSGAAGLELIAAGDPFAVVVSDMRMPVMDGAEFLKRVREAAPETVRVLLTGHADVAAAILAVNQGQIFRFLNKPCPPDVLIPALEASVEQYRLVTAEHALLDKTLKGSVTVLVELLSMASPIAFSRATQIRNYVSHAAGRLGWTPLWRFEMAALLSQIGCLALPPDTLDKLYSDRELSASETQMVGEHPETAYRLLSRIPRLEAVAEIIRGQGKETSGDPGIRRGIELLRAALDLDRLVVSGLAVPEAVARLERAGRHDREVLRALHDFRDQGHGESLRVVRVADLRSFMILDQDVRTTGGTIVVGKGKELNAVLIERLRNFARGVGIEEPIRVRLPAAA